ncbi:hypothetical protein LS73_002260 [Helicobacter muridarum]|uniref:Uncharacterized conserved protein n=1 Tax=Helicobacter muridarum TaxID=216 RepID=A0A099U0J7_9HELI|nr:pyridoxamine 5'-phosphate oxidase family protein [Helicobacter muridarum]TLE01118.1 hypothetical protein LS73_002260 [Helicobacter muridarum]STQ85986.1 Uncharacterized conserved protein [Helicobacter muridarum]
MYKDSEFHEVASFLEQNNIQILSTSFNNNPISRPVGSVIIVDNKIWYCVGNDKLMFSQLQDNPRICICVCANDFSWIRIMADAVFNNDIAVKKIFISKGNTRFSDPDDDMMSIFYLSNVYAEIHRQGNRKIFRF